MPERTTDAAASEPESPAPESRPEGAEPETTPQQSQMPEYKGEPLEAERGPGLGCFWIQIALLTFFLVFTPLTVTWGWPPIVSAALLIFTLILLLFSGQTIIFLLRLVAADRRTRRAPLNPSAKPTVGQMEDIAPETPAAAVDPDAGTDADAGTAVDADAHADPGADAGTDADEPEPNEEKPADG